MKFEGVKKAPLVEYDENENEDDQYNRGNDGLNDPFVRADSLVVSGNGKFIVCCTGNKSTRGN